MNTVDPYVGNSDSEWQPKRISRNFRMLMWFRICRWWLPLYWSRWMRSRWSPLSRTEFWPEIKPLSTVQWTIRCYDGSTYGTCNMLHTIFDSTHSKVGASCRNNDGSYFCQCTATACGDYGTCKNIPVLSLQYDFKKFVILQWSFNAANPNWWFISYDEALERWKCGMPLWRIL